MEKKPYHHKNLKNDLIEKGIELVNKNGINQLSLRKVAQACGVSHAAPYSHFSNKEELLQEMQLHITKKFTEVLENTVSQYRGTPIFLLEFGKAYISFFISHPQYFNFLFQQGNIQIDLNIDSGRESNYQPFAIYKEQVLKLLADTNMTQSKKEDLIVALFAYVQGLTTLATMENVHYAYKWEDKLTDLKEQLEDCNITAPCGGVVTAVNVSVGDVNADSKTPLVTIEDTSSLKMVATVEEADILKIEEGMKATVTADAMGDETINGTVTRVVRVKGQSTGSDGQTTSGGYSVEISLDNKELLVGMEVKAKVMIKEKGEVLAIPYDLVKTDDDGNTYVLVAEANADGSATAVKKNITVGEEVDYYTEVTGGDLAEGDKLIYDYSGTVTEGQQFTPEQMYSEQDMGTGASTDETSDAEGMSTSVEGNE